MKCCIPLIKQHKTLFVSVGVAILFVVLITHATHLLICDSGSIPGVRVSLVLKGSPYKPGDMVGIKDHPVKYGGKKFLVKYVAGLPGDKIERKSKEVHLITQGSHNNEVFPQKFPLLKQTKDGRPLNPLEATVVPKGYVFVAGDHLRSFDSRYLEFGLVHQNHIIGRAIKLW